jgi:hypothetical protein
MSNPYEPPGAPVADPQPVVLARPGVVTAALIILWFLLALWALMSLGHLSQVDNSTDPWSIAYAAYLVGMVIAPAAFLVKIAQGRNWARIAAMILFALNFLWRIYLLYVSEDTSVATLVGILVPDTLQLLGYVLLCFPSSTEWFRANSSR